MEILHDSLVIVTMLQELHIIHYEINPNGPQKEIAGTLVQCHMAFEICVTILLSPGGVISFTERKIVQQDTYKHL